MKCLFYPLLSSFSALLSLNPSRRSKSSLTNTVNASSPLPRTSPLSSWCHLAWCHRATWDVSPWAMTKIDVLLLAIYNHVLNIGENYHHHSDHAFRAAAPPPALPLKTYMHIMSVVTLAAQALTLPCLWARWWPHVLRCHTAICVALHNRTHIMPVIALSPVPRCCWPLPWLCVMEWNHRSNQRLWAQRHNPQDIKEADMCERQNKQRERGWVGHRG